jgi:formate dehydrogenase major subunit
MNSPREIQSICPYCAEGCGFYTSVEQGKALNINYMKNHPVNEGGLCLKGNMVLDVIYHPRRIDSPLLKKDDNTFDKISWDEAINVIASHFKKIIRKYGPNSLAFLTSAYCTNEENYLFQKFARIIGTNNVDCSSFYEGNLSSVELTASLGCASLTNPFSDLTNSQCILISGSNFTENHPIVSHWVFEAKSRGAKIIYIDHRAPSSLLIADHFLQINTGTHAALIDGMIIHILEKHLFNQQFITERTSGFEALQKTMRKQSLKNMEKISGIPVAKIKEVAQIYASSSASAIIHCTDFSFQSNHNSTINLANLALLCGHLGRSGTGIFSLLEHNNAQGSYDMGISPNILPGQVSTQDDIHQKRIAKLWKLKKLSPKRGLSFPEMIKALQRRKIKALYIMESNPLEEHAYAHQLKQALKKVEFLLVQDLFLTETAKQANIVLPVNSWAEKTGTYTNTERRVQWQSKIINPQKQIIPNWQVLCRIAKKLGLKKQFSFRNSENILREINKTIPAYTGISANRVNRIDGLIWPCPTPKHPGTPILYTEHFNTPDTLGKFSTVPDKKRKEKPTKKYPFYLTFGKSLAFYSSGNPPASPELFVEINPKIAKKIHIKNHSEVKITTKLGSVKATACISEKVLPGVVFIPFFLASGSGSRTFTTFDPRAKIPELNTTTCQIKASGGK